LGIGGRNMFKSNKIKFKNHYQTEAKQYDRHRLNCTCKIMYDEILKETIYNYIKECDYILEAGCGTGRFSIYLAKKGKKVVAMDASKEMLNIAREKAVKENVENKIEFVEGDIENIPFNDKSFHGVLSFAVLRHFNPPEKGISELCRVMWDDGVMVIDILNKKIFRYYDFYRKLIGKKPNIPNEHFFTNYYLNLNEMEESLSKGHMQLFNHKGIIKFPSHLILCKLKLKFFKKIIKIIEKNINFGAIILLQIKKRGHNDL